MGIRKRLVGSYLLVILITVITLEAILIAAVNYYYHNIERTLVTQAELSASFYEQYFAEEDLEQQAERLLGGFSHHFAGQVQIIGSSGQLIQDTSGFRLGQNMTGFPDVRSAIAGFADTWRGQDLAWQEEVLAVSYPLVAKGQTAGAVRFITSLKQTEETVRQIALIFVAVGLVVIALVAAVGIVLSGMITKSITGLKRAAEKMADGDFSVRAEKAYKDELGALTDTLNTMAGTIQRQEQLKNDFISSVSHELLDFSKFGDGRMELSRSPLLLPDGARLLTMPDGKPNNGISYGDLDGDGQNEATVVYEEEVGRERTLKAALLMRRQEAWQIVWHGEGSGHSLDYAGIRDVDRDGAAEILLGWSLGAGVNGLDIYEWDKGTLKLQDRKGYHESTELRDMMN